MAPLRAEARRGQAIQNVSSPVHLHNTTPRDMMLLKIKLGISLKTCEEKQLTCPSDSRHHCKNSIHLFIMVAND